VVFGECARVLPVSEPDTVMVRATSKVDDESGDDQPDDESDPADVSK
jgi:hypothetical protein